MQLRSYTGSAWVNGPWREMDAIRKGIGLLLQDLEEKVIRPYFPILVGKPVRWIILYCPEVNGIGIWPPIQ